MRGHRVGTGLSRRKPRNRGLTLALTSDTESPEVEPGHPDVVRVVGVFVGDHDVGSVVSHQGQVEVGEGYWLRHRILTLTLTVGLFEWESGVVEVLVEHELGQGVVGILTVVAVKTVTAWVGRFEGGFPHGVKDGVVHFAGEVRNSWMSQNSKAVFYPYSLLLFSFNQLFNRPSIKRSRRNNF